MTDTLDRKRIAVIAGPTATGKSDVAVKLALSANGEVVSFDSMQIYSGMEIGTAAPTKDEMSGVAHHMIGFLSPESEFSCSDYVTLAGKTVDDILKRDKLPVLCGGTGLYMENLIYGNVFSPKVPNEIEKKVSEMDIDQAYEMLRELDSESAERIHKNNEKRVRRALAIVLGTGKTKTEWDKESRGEPVYDAKLFILDCRDRQVLYERINRRVDKMFDAGLIKEAAEIREKLGKTASAAIGFKEIFDYLDGLTDENEARERIKQASRRYAKRQITWFSRYKDAIRYYIDERETEEIISDMLENLK